MDDKIKSVIDGYIANVEDVCCKLLEGINTQENQDLRTKWDFFEYRGNVRKTEFIINDITYRLHGKGCFAFGEGLFLNWDFGYRSRWCGIDPWMLGMTLKLGGSSQTEYFDGKLLDEACELAVMEGEMFKKNGLYHYSINKVDTFLPDFPKEYDTLVIEYSHEKWILPRSKMTDRFIRKSNWICNQIWGNKNTYVLRFFLENRELYSVPYDDINYPEHAIKIMTDTILWNLKKQLTVHR